MTGYLVVVVNVQVEYQAVVIIFADQIYIWLSYFRCEIVVYMHTIYVE